MGKIVCIDSQLTSTGEPPYEGCATLDFASALFRLPVWDFRDIWLSLAGELRSKLRDLILQDLRLSKKYNDLSATFAFLDYEGLQWGDPGDLLLERKALDVGMISHVEFLTDGRLYLVVNSARYTPEEFQEQYAMSHEEYIETEVAFQASKIKYVVDAMCADLRDYEVTVAQGFEVKTLTIRAHTVDQASALAAQPDVSVLEVR